MDRPEDVWYRDPGALVRHPAEFFPARYQTGPQRANSLVRLFAYVGAGVGAYKRAWGPVVLGLLAGLVVSIAFAYSSVSPGGAGGADGMPGVAGRVTTVQGPLGPTAVTMEGVAIRSAGDDGECVRPSMNNPFANFLLTDAADRPDRPAACPYDAVKDEVRRYFNAGLPRNVGDVYEKQNSQRQFYTMPNSRGIPDTAAFAQFLYGTAPGCKVDPSKCTGYV